MCGRVIQASGRLNLAIIDGLEVGNVRRVGPRPRHAILFEPRRDLAGACRISRSEKKKALHRPGRTAADGLISPLQRPAPTPEGARHGGQLSLMGTVDFAALLPASGFG
jgi:hypothetical protein